MGYRHSDWFSLPPAGASIRPVVILLWITDDAPYVSLSLPLDIFYLCIPPQLFLSLLCFCTVQSLSVFSLVHPQTVTERDS